MKVNHLFAIGPLLIGVFFLFLGTATYTPPEFALKWGTPGDGPGEFAAPEGIAIGPNGRIYVADTNNHRVQVFSSEGEFLFEWGSFCDLETEEGCRGEDGAGQFNAPEAVLYSPLAGIVYVADSSNHRIQAFGPDGEFLFAWGSVGSAPGQFVVPVGLAADADGNVYVADVVNHRVQVFDLQGRFLRSWGEKGSDPGQFRFPSGVAVFENRVYVADNLNHRVQVFDLDGNYLDEWGTLCDLRTGEGCSDPDGAGPLEVGDGQLRKPFGIAVDAEGWVFVLDQGNSRVQVFSPEGEFLAKWGSLCALYGEESNELPPGEGCVDPDGDGPLAPGDGQFLFPKGIAVSADGTVYIADSDNPRVQVFR